MKPFGICTASLRFLTVVLPLTQLSSADPAIQLLDSGLTGGGTASANIGNGEVMTLASETGRGDVAAIASVANVVMYPGRLGQIYEISEASLAITSVAERSQVLVIPSFIMTDSTTVADPLAVIVWNPSSGPADMLEDGSVKTGAVYQDTPVTLEGRLSGAHRQMRCRSRRSALGRSRCGFLDQPQPK